jgi:hypothetical protein
VSNNFEVENDSIKKMMKDIGGRIHSAIEHSDNAGKVGFALLIFEFGEGGFMFYTSNADRKNMVLALKELIVKQDAEED